MTSLKPIRLPANQPKQFYRGGAAIADLRGLSTQDQSDPSASFGPEDWVASTTALNGRATEGLSPLPDGRWLRDAVAADPAAWLGSRHVATFADSTALLVKLLDAGQRLPVHFHPDDAFARRHFDSHFGKTEAWIVAGTSGDAPRVHAGFRESQSRATLDEWVREQDSPSMLEALNSIPVSPGDTVHIPAGLPHAIGEGVFVVELQQPTDFSLTIEWRDFLDAPEKGHLGLGFDTALDALDRTGWDPDRLAGIVRRTEEESGAVVNMLADPAAGFFRADRLRPNSPIALDPSFAVLVVLDGAGALRTADGGELALAKGDTVVVPHAAGKSTVDGELTVVRCRPPEPTEGA